jgi:hypothetical protein
VYILSQINSGHNLATYLFKKAVTLKRDHLGRPGGKWKGSIEMDLKEIGY